MGMRAGPAAVVSGVVGVAWWLASRLAWAAVGCGDWGCLPYTLGLQLVLALATLAGAAALLNSLEIRPGGRTALVAASVLVALWVAAKALPWWPPYRVAGLLATCGSFAAAGAVGAFVTDARVHPWWRFLLLAAVLAVPAAGFMVQAGNAWT